MRKLLLAQCGIISFNFSLSYHLSDAIELLSLRATLWLLQIVGNVDLFKNFKLSAEINDLTIRLSGL